MPEERLIGIGKNYPPEEWGLCFGLMTDLGLWLNREVRFSLRKILSLPKDFALTHPLFF